MQLFQGERTLPEAPQEVSITMRIRSVSKHALQAIAEGSLIAMLVVGLVAGTAFAAKGGGGGSSYSGTIALAPLVVDANSNGLPNRGDVVTFDITSTSGAPYVLLECFQGSRLVLSGRKGYFEASLDTSRNFGLASGLWASGTAADCTASLANYTKRGWSRYASVSFYVAA